ncbi:MAG: response regulator [Balneolaceae bacterium]|nr:response regulator [Balneolaceae bacterium]
MLTKLFRWLIFATLWFLPLGHGAFAQSDSALYLSLADTNSAGNILLYQLDAWQFSFSKPDTIADRKNLENTIPGSVNDMRELKALPEWNDYGWFELEFHVDASLAGRQWELMYSNPEPARIWLNGHLILTAGNPSPTPDDETLSLFVNGFSEGIILREGINYLLIEYSEHTYPELFKPYRLSEHGVWVYLNSNEILDLRRYRAFIFGGACMLLLLLLVMQSYLAYQFREQYHKYISLTTFFMLFHALTSMSDTIINWSYSYVYFYQYSYAISFLFVVYFFLIAIRKIFEIPIPWKSLTSALIISVILGLYAATFSPTFLNILHPVMAILTLIYGIYSLFEAKKNNPAAKIGTIVTGLVLTIGGAVLYVTFYVALGYLNIWFFLVIVLMAYTGIPISLTFNIAASYANLITTLEKKVRDRTADLETANEFQNRFFANISHEFRTPLTISKGLLNKVINNNGYVSEEAKKDLRVMNRNMNRLHDMVNQIIDLTKADKNHLSLNQKYYDADNLVKISVESFRSLAENHGHELYLHPEAQNAVLYADRTKVEVMINNLISNAIKFTHDGGKITVSTGVKDQMFYVSVQDTGPGIPESEKEQIFERFHRIKKQDEEYVEGMGVGLELSRSLARLHGGDLMLEPNTGLGACFKLELPISDVPSTDVIVLENDTIDEEEPVIKEINRAEAPKSFNILLVEDNADMMDYVSGILSDVGTIKQAKNGKHALEVLDAFTPDIIVTDLMMPVMGGLELVEELKKNPKWKDVPILVLTAKALEDDKLHLLRIGVVDYITKPFVPDHLVLKIKNLLNYYNRRKTIRLSMEAESVEADSNFAEKVAQFVSDNLQNSNLTVDFIANEFAQSRRSFYRNIQSETGMTPAEFIREVRLTTARTMVAGNDSLRLEELAAAVGYKSATSFRKAYEQRFGEHPLN